LEKIPSNKIITSIRFGNQCISVTGILAFEILNTDGIEIVAKTKSLTNFLEHILSRKTENRPFKLAVINDKVGSGISVFCRN